MMIQLLTILELLADSEMNSSSDDGELPDEVMNSTGGKCNGSTPDVDSDEEDLIEHRYDMDSFVISCNPHRRATDMDFLQCRLHFN